MSDLFETRDLVRTGPTDPEVDDKILECVATLARFNIGLEPIPTIYYDLTGSVAGWAIGIDKIRLNRELLSDPRYRADMIENTVPHELAHIVVHQKWPEAPGHGREWKRVMNMLGVPANRCHNYETVQKGGTFEYWCGCQVHKLSLTRHDRVQRGVKRYHCVDCGGVLKQIKEVKGPDAHHHH